MACCESSIPRTIGLYETSAGIQTPPVLLGGYFRRRGDLSGNALAGAVPAALPCAVHGRRSDDRLVFRACAEPGNHCSFEPVVLLFHRAADRLVHGRSAGPRAPGRVHSDLLPVLLSARRAGPSRGESPHQSPAPLAGAGRIKSRALGFDVGQRDCLAFAEP